MKGGRIFKKGIKNMDHLFNEIFEKAIFVRT